MARRDVIAARHVYTYGEKPWLMFRVAARRGRGIIFFPTWRLSRSKDFANKRRFPPDFSPLASRDGYRDARLVENSTLKVKRREEGNTNIRVWPALKREILPSSGSSQRSCSTFVIWKISSVTARASQPWINHRIFITPICALVYVTINRAESCVIALPAFTRHLINIDTSEGQ